MPRDYDITGPNAQHAIEAGLVTPAWYRTDIERPVMKALMKRSDQPALRDTILLFSIIGIAALGAIAVMPSWWSLPLWLIYGFMYGSAMDSRWHECGHGTAFKTRWMNQVVYQIASFCMVRDPYCWKYSHARHHSDTIIVGRDPEIAIMRPVKVIKLIANFVGLIDMWDGMRRMIHHAFGRILPDEAAYMEPIFYTKTIRTARIWVLIYAATLITAVVWQTWVPLLLIGLPRLYGCWHMTMCGWLQHGGLADNVLDHRLNCRTVYMNPISRFIYWNMNYHVEHHMFPLVPYYKLPQLHQICAHDFPAANTSIFSAYQEMLPALLKQRFNPDFYLRRSLPQTARPYHDGPEVAQ